MARNPLFTRGIEERFGVALRFQVIARFKGTAGKFLKQNVEKMLGQETEDSQFADSTHIYFTVCHRRHPESHSDGERVPSSDLLRVVKFMGDVTSVVSAQNRRQLIAEDGILQ